MFRNYFKFSYSSALFIFSLFGYCKVFSQDQSNLPVIKKFQSYSSKALQEKLFLHTDKDFYVAGEILWFKIYYADGAFHKPIQLSKIAYVEILNTLGKAELQAKISLEPGQSKGSFYLPVALNSGNYTIRAYTNWMKNFDAGYFFEKKITIVNTLRNSELLVHKDSMDFTIDFFPEGGNLVSDVPCKIGFRATNAKGKGVDFSGFVINDAGDTVSGFTPYKFGIGNFLLKPLSNHSYKAVILLPGGRIINKPLPEVFNHGYVMNLYDEGADFLRIAVHRKKLPGDPMAEELLLAAHTRQVLHVAEAKIIGNSDSIIFIIAKAKIGRGITHFTLFNGKGKPVCERLFFMRPTSAITLNVKADQDLYKTRSKVSLSLTADYDHEIKTPLNLSASVFNLDLLQQIDQADIITYMWLTSDLTGDVESPAFYFTNNSGVDIAVDNLMLTQGWRRFRWNDILNDETSFIKFLPEYNGHLISATIKDHGKAAKESDVFLSIPGHPFGFYVSRTDTDGLAQFEVKNYYGNGYIIAGPQIQSDSSYTVHILSPYSGSTTLTESLPYEPGKEMKEQLLNRSISMQVQNIYSGEDLRKFTTPHIADTLPFFGYPEVTYKLDDYKRFTTMEEVLREYVREVNVGVKNGKLTFKMYNPALSDFHEDDMLVLVDGVPLADPNKIFSYDPLKVKKLDIIQSQYILGQSIYNGIASFSTYEGALDKFEYDPRRVAIDYDGLQLQREFYSPEYETKEQLERRIPDFRNTLLWSPNVTTDQEGKTKIWFYTSDQAGKYMVVLQGMSASGDFVSAHTFLEVK